MAYKVQGDNLENVSARETLKFANRNINPKYIAVHYTAGSSLESSIRHLKKKGFSYHILIDRDGSVVQGAPLTKRASHAGYSNWKGRNSLNNWAIGISLANLGYLDPQGDQFFNLNSHGEPISPRLEPENVLLSTHPNGHIGSSPKGWEVYTDAQYAAINEVIEALLVAFPSIIDAVGHDEIAIGRKPDPGPAFDWERIHHLFPRRASEVGPLYRVNVRNGDHLNVRSGPNGKWPVIKKLAPGEKVHLHSHAYRYAAGKPVKTEWVSIAREGQLDHLGFVHASFLRST